MLKPTRTILALAAGSLVLGLVGAGAAVAADHPAPHDPARTTAAAPADDDDDDYDGGDSRRHTKGVVTSRGPLNVRSKPTTHSHKVGRLRSHEKVEIECKTRGERVGGNNIWYLLEDDKRDDERDDNDGMDGGGKRAMADRHDHWVSARYVKNFGEVKYCRS